MERNSPRWHQITPSEFSWEQEALDHVREFLPDGEPVEAWANFEFISDHGRVYEVDLLVVTPKGLFFVEIKSRPGALEGDGGTWTWHTDGRQKSYENPLLLANRKAKALKSLLERQKAVRSGKTRLPFLQAYVFVSAEKLTSRLSPDGAHHVYGREAAAPSTLPSIKDGLLTIDPEQYARRGKPVDRPTAQMVARAMDQAGIRPSNRQRRVGDYEIGKLTHDGPGFQDFVGTHQTLPDFHRRIRIYSVAPDADDALRQTVQRAAAREFRTLQGLSHTSILKALDLKVSDLGPALLFEHHPSAVRLDRYLADRGDSLTMDTRLSLVRQIAEALDYAHGRHVVHRALSPGAVEIVDPDATFPRVQVLNWQTSARDAESSLIGPVSATIHADRLVDDSDAAYMAPEVFGAADAVEQADVFSLGALAFLIFSGRPPAASLSELVLRLHENHGLAIETVLDGAGTALSHLIRWATTPEVSQRTASVRAFLDDLTELEEELTRPEEDETVDPAVATAGDLLAPGLTVAGRIGQGSSAVVFQIKELPEEQVLKVAIDTDQNDRLRSEWEILNALRHPNVVTIEGPALEVGDRVAIRMQRAGDRTLAQRLREEGPLALDLLRRFGEELLDTVVYLDGEGIAHRDIKPGNLGVGSRTKKDELRLVLFDFSLSRTPREVVHAGTHPYLEPFLVHRVPPRWDEQAERFAAAVTLYEMATAQLPVWGDGQSDPAALTCEVTIDQEIFEPSLAPGFADFFRRALAREPDGRFPTARAMREAWQAVFSQLDAPATVERSDEHMPIDSAQLDTALRALDLSIAALDALERASVYTVRDLLRAPFNEIIRRRGVGTRVKREIGTLTMDLRALGFEPDGATSDDGDDGGRSIDAIAARLVPKETAKNAGDVATLRALLGTADGLDLGHWPGQADVASATGRSRADVARVLDSARERWRRQPAMTGIAADVVHLVDTHEGVITARELAASLLALRGSIAEEPERSRRALAVARAAVELDQGRASALAELRLPREVALTPDRDDGAAAAEILGYVQSLGAAADEIASADPLLAPTTARARLDQVEPPSQMEPLSDSRIVRLAAAASISAAASSRLELYPLDMEPARALRLARTALLGPEKIAPDDISSRVHARFPEARPLPTRPALDDLLTEAGLAFRWSEADNAYRAPSASVNRATSHTSIGRVETGHFTELVEGREEARRFEERLERLADRGGFLALSVSMRRLPNAESELARFPVQPIDIDELLLERMREVASGFAKPVKWDVVLRADAAARDSREWRNLQSVVKLAVPEVKKAILAHEGNVLLTRLGLLGRYGQIELIEELRELVVAGRAGSLTGLWVLAVASDDGAMPTIDGEAIPVLTPDQWAAIPEVWLANRHRGVIAAGP